MSMTFLDKVDKDNKANGTQELIQVAGLWGQRSVASV